MRAQLIPVDGGAPFDIQKDLTLVGRKEGCDIRLDHKSVSKVHCALVKTAGMLFIRDLGSTNGTKVNGKRIRRHALMPNDQLHIAGFNFKVVIGTAGRAHPHDATQHLDASEVKDLLAEKMAEATQKKAAANKDVQIRINPLPDAYPDDEKDVKRNGLERD